MTVQTGESYGLSWNVGNSPDTSFKHVSLCINIQRYSSVHAKLTRLKLSKESIRAVVFLKHLLISTCMTSDKHGFFFPSGIRLNVCSNISHCYLRMTKISFRNVKVIYRDQSINFTKFARIME